MRTILLFLLCHVAIKAAAWGPGHDAIQKAILDRLPPFLKAGLSETYLQRLITEYSHYPDSFAPFEESVIGAESIQRLSKAGISKRYDIHHDRNRGMAFLELVHAIREKNNERANFWIACLAHSAADMAAINHDPVTHTVYYLWGEERKAIKTTKGNFPDYLDIHDVTINASGLRIFNEQIKDMRIADAQESLTQSLANIMFYGHEGAHYLALRGFDIVDMAISYADEENQTLREELFREMSNLGAWAVVRMLRDVDIAVRIASSDAELVITDHALKAYEQMVTSHVHGRQLDDGMFQAISPFQPRESDPAIGVLTEPSWRMNDGLIGFTERILSFQIANSLRKNATPFRLINIVETLKNGFPAPDNTPVIILPIRQTNKTYFGMSTDKLDRHLKKYTDSGGKVIWIGGGPPSKDLLPALNQSMVTKLETGWHQQQSGEPISMFISKKSPWKLTGNLKPKVGWLFADCLQVFDPKAMKINSTAPFLTLVKATGETMPVGAYYPKKRPTAVFIPTYALIPFMWTTSHALPNPIIDASLDETGNQILNSALTLLGKNSLVASKQ